MNSLAPISLVINSKSDMIEKFREYKAEYVQEFFNDFFIGAEYPAKNAWEKTVMYMYSVVMSGIVDENVLYEDVYVAFSDFYCDTREYYTGPISEAVDNFFIRMVGMIEHAIHAKENDDVQPVKMCYSRPPTVCDLPSPSELFA
jgi:hypothetical protein